MDRLKNPPTACNKKVFARKNFSVKDSCLKAGGLKITLKGTVDKLKLFADYIKPIIEVSLAEMENAIAE
jgi:hypothetical protein